jgi:predicted glycosyltransferase involved in capsule biosynthesis
VNNGYTFTYIIGYRHKLERITNLKKVLEWLSGFNGVEIIIVEQDSSPKLPTFTLKGFKYIFTKSNFPYNRSWAFNVGLKNSTTNVIAFGDSDLIMTPTSLIESIKQLQNYECVSPYNKVIDLEMYENNLNLIQLEQINRPGRGELDNQKINLTGGIVIYRKESILKIGGWDQSFIGWGAEDDFQTHKTKMLLSWFENKAKVFHLYHDKVKPDMIYYQRNLQILNKIITFKEDELKKYIMNNAPKNGSKNTYCDK